MSRDRRSTSSRRRACSVLAAVALAAAASVRAAGPEPPKLRLPAGVAPSRYAAELWLDPAKETFEGKIQIEISLKEETGAVWLNATELNVRTISARPSTAADPKDAIPAEATPAGPDHVRIHFQRNLASGPWILTLAYSGRIDVKGTNGIFRQKEGGDWYVFSQFESIFARRAFPCFDEPSFKTPWQITIHAPKGAIAVSNTPVTSESADADGGRLFVFAETKPLPSYLVAFAVGPFDVVPAGNAGRNRIPIRIFVPRGRGADARHAAETTGPILELLESYFGTPYPYGKLDELVIPQTVTFSAMENAGLITYASKYILARKTDETISFRRLWADTCAHEAAHQWFGDYVTTAWWDDVWLNEAFATWMASKIVDRWKPEWKGEAQRAAERSQAMSSDTLVTARRVRQPIVQNDDIEDAFDAITYYKGAAVIAMFERWLGEETFRKGIQSYLKAHAWGSATSDDFVAAIADAARNPAVAPAFRSFLDQPGLPLVTAELVCDGAGPRLLLSQRRFLQAGSAGSPKESWRIPVCARTGDPGATTTCTILAEPSGTLPLPGACPARVLANAGEGYYRVLYKGSLLGKVLADGGRHLSPAERVATLSDVGALARGLDVPMAAALALVPAFANDPDRNVLGVVQGIAATPADLLVTNEMRPRYASFVRDVFGARARALGWKPKPGEDEDTQLLREELVPFVAAEGEDPVLAAEAFGLAKSWLKDRSAVDAAMVSAVLGVAARYGDAALFQAFAAEARKTTDRRERTAILEALGGFRDPPLVSAALALTLSTDLDARETIVILREETRHGETRPQAWEFLKANFDRLVERLPRETPANFPWLAARFGDLQHRKEAETFFQQRMTNYLGGPHNLAEALEWIDLRVAFRAAQQESVDEFLRQYEPKPTIDVAPR
jgi:alanyl aminopeptidase